MRRDYILSLTQRERELLAGSGIADLDLARRVNLVPVRDGWVTLGLTRRELESLMWVACQASDDACQEALRAAATRMGRVLRGSPPHLDPERGRARPVVAAPAMAMNKVDVPLTAADRIFLCAHLEVLEDLPPALARKFTGEGSGPVRVLLGEALLLADCLDQVGMSPEVSDRDADRLFDLLHRIVLARPKVPVTVGPNQRIPVALCQSELALLRARPDLLPRLAAGLLREDVLSSGPRILLTLEEVDELLSRLAEQEEIEELRRLENRLEQVQRGFSPPS